MKKLQEFAGKILGMKILGNSRKLTLAFPTILTLLANGQYMEAIYVAIAYLVSQGFADGLQSIASHGYFIVSEIKKLIPEIKDLVVAYREAKNK